MQINRNWFIKPNYVFEGDLDFSSQTFTGAHIKSIESCHFQIKGNNYDSLFVMEVKVSSKVITYSAYSLKEIPLDLNIADIINISDEDEDDEDIFYEKNAIFDIDPYILSLIVASVPTVVVDKNEKLPEDGNGYRILTEEEYEEEQRNKKDDRWSQLDNLDLD